MKGDHRGNNRSDVMRVTVEFKLVKHLSTSDLVQMCNGRLLSVLLLPLGQSCPCPPVTPQPPHVVPVAAAFPQERRAHGKALCSSCSAEEEQVFTKQMRRGFNFGACLEVVFTEHVEDIFRGDYEWSQSVS